MAYAVKMETRICHSSVVIKFFFEPPDFISGLSRVFIVFTEHRVWYFSVFKKCGLYRAGDLSGYCAGKIRLAVAAFGHKPASVQGMLRIAVFGHFRAS